MRQTRYHELIILVASFTLHSTVTAASPRDMLNISRPLHDGEILISAGSTFALGFFSPNNSSSTRYVGVWFHNISSHDITWVANAHKPVSGFAGSLTLTPNGRLVLVDRNNSDEVIWYSSSPFNADTNDTNLTAQLLETGNLVVRPDTAATDHVENSIYTWQSFDYPSNVVLPGMFLGWDLRTGLNRNISSWTSLTDPSPGVYTTAISLRGVPQLIETHGNSLYWRGGPWVSKAFTGTQQINAYHVINTTFVVTNENVGYCFKLDHGLAFLKLYPDGTMERLVWLDEQWSLFWKTPKDQCDAFSPCGPFGICNADETPICSCLRGFRPKKPGPWALRDVSDGCLRNKELGCRPNGTNDDGFLEVSGVKLPDTSAAVADGELGLDECRIRCLINCSCIAYALTDVTAGGSGCIMWVSELNDMRLFSQGGQDLYVRVAAADVDESTGSKGKSIVVIVVPILGTLFVGFLLISCLIIYRRKRMNRMIQKENNQTASDGSDIELPLFDFETIAEATNNFSDDNKLGEGGFGPVYKGRKKDGEEIAVKRLSKSSKQGIKEFKNEIMLIAKLQHRNLVRLLGCCVQSEERMLIYEYMSNKSLDKFLFDKEKMMLLNWEMRYRIVVGIARGLLYLHQDSVVRIIHRDLKASNILLNQEMVPKISDFGLARIFEDEAKSETKRLVGTYGYMSPEYLMDGFFSIKSDVFSFGVIVLEVLSNQKNRSSHSNNHVIQKAWNLWKEGKALELVDSSIGDSFSIAEVLRFIKVGLLCVQESPDERPNMSSVILMLTSDKEVLPEPNQPGFVARKYHVEVDHSSSSKQESESVNKLTLTIPHGR